MHSYNVTFMDNKKVAIETVVFKAEDKEKLETLVEDYVASKRFLSYLPSISWAATTLVARGTITIPEVKEIESDDTSDYGADKDVYCRNCGLSNGVKFEATYASGDYYRCEPCEVGFHA